MAQDQVGMRLDTSTAISSVNDTNLWRTTVQSGDAGRVALQLLLDPGFHQSQTAQPRVRAWLHCPSLEDKLKIESSQKLKSWAHRNEMKLFQGQMQSVPYRYEKQNAPL